MSSSQVMKKFPVCSLFSPYLTAQIRVLGMRMVTNLPLCRSCKQTAHPCSCRSGYHLKYVDFCQCHYINMLKWCSAWTCGNQHLMKNENRSSKCAFVLQRRTTEQRRRLFLQTQSSWLNKKHRNVKWWHVDWDEYQLSIFFACSERRLLSCLFPLQRRVWRHSGENNPVELFLFFSKYNYCGCAVNNDLTSEEPTSRKHFPHQHR